MRRKTWTHPFRRACVVVATVATVAPLAVVTSAQARTVEPSAAGDRVSVIPQPQRLEVLDEAPVVLDRSTVIVVRGNRPEARTAAEYLAGILRPSTGYPLPISPAVPGNGPAIVLDAAGQGRADGEAYRLWTKNSRVHIAADGANGLALGIQTLRQLLPAAVEARTVQPDVGWTVPAVEIDDRPRFAYRGAMLDVARRFMSVVDVKRYVDQMALYKLNVLHLHLTDDQGWRIAIDQIPALTQVGASTQSGWAPGTGGPWFYTKDDYREIVAHAQARHITVVPEVDGPGHTWAALASVPGLNCNDQARQPYYGFDVGISLVCLTDQAHRDNVRDFLDVVMGELTALSPGRYVHIGGDETPAATAEQYSSYIDIAGNAVTQAGKAVMGWHQVGAGPLPAGSLLQYWGDASDRATIGTGNESAGIRDVRAGLAQGARVVSSPADRAYLDMKYDRSTPYGLSWAGFTTVQKAYEWDPVSSLARPDGTHGMVTEQQVAGVEAPLWTDRAYRGSSSLPKSLDQFPEPGVYSDYMTFPRLPGIAEIGWSSAGGRSWSEYRERLAQHGARWDAMGISFFRSPEIPWPS